ncbi:hypothetical protein L1987_71069 [Smallanthus sonchifolius]|uniref:Uncharacterized protein n=1 Tax=Smallanthus sonchifolius TaxID=185202 RepID=A0ACB9ASS3_9ASTR|nr:hypothetical protein L1987_71069 [Smallanthus sonchifolius]
MDGASLGFDKKRLPEILSIVGVGSFVSQLRNIIAGGSNPDNQLKPSHTEILGSNPDHSKKKKGLWHVKGFLLGGCSRCSGKTQLS